MILICGGGIGMENAAPAQREFFRGARTQVIFNPLNKTCFTTRQRVAALAHINPMPQLQDQQSINNIPLDVFMEVLAYLDCKKDGAVNPSIVSLPQFIEAAGKFLRNPAGLQPHIRSFITRVTNGDFRKHIMSLKALAEHNIVNKGEPVCFFVHRTVGELNEQLSKGYTVYKGEPYPVPLPHLKFLKKDSGPSLSMLRDGYPGAPMMEEVFSCDSTFDPGARLKVGDKGVYFDKSIDIIPPELIIAFGYGQVIDSITFEYVGEDRVRIIIIKKNGKQIVLDRKTKSYENFNTNKMDIAIGNQIKNGIIGVDGTEQEIVDNLVIVKELGDGTQGMMASLNAGTQNIEYAIGTADEIVTLRSRLMLVGVLLLLSAEKEYANIGRVIYYSQIVDLEILLKNEMDNARKAALQHNRAYADRLKMINGTQIRIGRKILTGKWYVDLANNELKEVKSTAFFDFINEVLNSLTAANEFINGLDIEVAYQNRETGGVTRFKELCLMGKANHIISDIQHKGDTIGSTNIIVIGKIGSVKRLFSPLFPDTSYEAMDVIHQKNIQTNRFISSREQIHQILNQSPSSTIKSRKQIRGGYIGGGEPVCAPELNNNCIFFDEKLNPTKRFYELIKEIIKAKIKHIETVSIYALHKSNSDDLARLETIADLSSFKWLSYYLTSSLDSIAYDIYQYLLPYFSWLGYTCLDRDTLEGLINILYDSGHLNSTHPNFMEPITMDSFCNNFYSLRLPAMELINESILNNSYGLVYREELFKKIVRNLYRNPVFGGLYHKIYNELYKNYDNIKLKPFHSKTGIRSTTGIRTHPYIAQPSGHNPHEPQPAAHPEGINPFAPSNHVQPRTYHVQPRRVSIKAGRRAINKHKRNKTVCKRKNNNKTLKKYNRKTKKRHA